MKNQYIVKMICMYGVAYLKGKTLTRNKEEATVFSKKEAEFEVLFSRSIFVDSPGFRLSLEKV